MNVLRCFLISLFSLSRVRSVLSRGCSLVLEWIGMEQRCTLFVAWDEHDCEQEMNLCGCNPPRFLGGGLICYCSISLSWLIHFYYIMQDRHINPGQIIKAKDLENHNKTFKLWSSRTHGSCGDASVQHARKEHVLVKVEIALREEPGRWDTRLTV